MKLAQNLVKYSFSIQLTNIWHKNRGESFGLNSPLREYNEIKEEIKNHENAVEYPI